ncbi:hypothetical protein Tco_0596623 [Tanacetum coccineum]
MKCTSAIRQLAYGTFPVALDEYLQMGHATSRLSLEHFYWAWFGYPITHKAQYCRRDHDPDPFILLEEMEDPNMTMEEYVPYETKKALRNGKVYNWKTATYGKIGYVEDINDLRFFETQFPAIVYDDVLTSELKFSSEPTEMDDLGINMKEYVQRETERALKNGKVYNWDTPTYGKIGYDKDVQYLKILEAEFPAIVYDDGFTFEL